MRILNQKVFTAGMLIGIAALTYSCIQNKSGGMTPDKVTNSSLQRVLFIALK